MRRYCLNGHDTLLVGRTKRQCRQCRREAQTTDQYRAQRRVRENSPKYREVTYARKSFWEMFTAMGITSRARTLLRKAGRL